VGDPAPATPAGGLARAEAEGRLGVSRSIKGRVATLGGTIELDTAPGAGVEWELRAPRPQRSEGEEQA
jgi:hypothetical protein